MLEVREISKSFKKTVAVDHLSMYIEKGESIGLLGPNGAGKSTTISMISTLLPPDNGTIEYKNINILKNASTIRPVLGVVPQEIALYEELSAYENMRFFGKIYGLKGTALNSKVDEVLKLVGLTERQKEPVKNYSGGMKRRINLAVALLHDPEVLIMDEPTVGIDPQSRNHILDTIRKLNVEHNLTILYTSHYMDEVEKLCDRIYIMDDGKIVASGTNKELKSLLSNEETVEIEVKTKKVEFAEVLKKHPDVNQLYETTKGYRLIVSKRDELLVDIFRQAALHEVTVTGIQVKEPTLEDVFLHLTGRKLRD
ncbi:ABC transporter ATP-binding protein [Marinilactibacillus sp. Marseille-P9653]|uniref:ABC transporter ATP-binding protein n=1 Tax=Marinilactibacillus sp. Marseille-P9653 TaxID=2866583 RepID=UPI001CE4AF0C|nr:ABC transporter ATP-binding protein [Marinilactibacillus sp. Marseille-P9653]